MLEDCKNEVLRVDVADFACMCGTEPEDGTGGENEFSSFNYWRRNYPVEVDADV